jgi:hypothetical protein
LIAIWRYGEDGFHASTVLDGKSFPIAKQNLIAFFELHPCLFDESTYTVQSSVTVEDFAAFLKYLESKQLPKITPANAKTLYLLSQEFGVIDLSSRCGELVSDRQTVDSPLMPLLLHSPQPI